MNIYNIQYMSEIRTERLEELLKKEKELIKAKRLIKVLEIKKALRINKINALIDKYKTEKTHFIQKKEYITAKVCCLIAIRLTKLKNNIIE